VKREPTKRAGGARTWRRVLSLLVPVALLAFSAALAADPPPADKGASVEVHLREYGIQMPETLPAGPTTFVVHNDGLKYHSFKLEAPGNEAILDKPLPPGETGSLTVTLKAGEYKVYCPIGSHEVKGMTRKLVVTAPPAH
jgi:plastocyanin